jgi:hypothetical protein
VQILTVAGGIALTNWGTFGATLTRENIGSGGSVDHGLVIEFRKKRWLRLAVCIHIYI